MHRAILTVMLLGGGACARPPVVRESPEAVPSASDAAAATQETATSLAPSGGVPPSPAPSEQAGGEHSTLTFKLETRDPVRCNTDQSNTPCVYKKGTVCFLRQSNCDRKPCTEGVHEQTACDEVVASAKKPRRVCLELRDLPPAAVVVFFRDGSQGGGTGPLDEGVAKFCGVADRKWTLTGDPDAAAWTLDLDWSKTTCIAVDRDSRTLAECQDPYPFRVFEGRI